MNKGIDKTAKVLAGIAALNVGTSKLLNFDVLSYVPTGMWTTLAIVVIGASGAYILYAIYDKKI